MNKGLIFGVFGLALLLVTPQAQALKDGLKSHTSVFESTAYGKFANADGINATALGHNTAATGNESVAVGDKARAIGHNAVSVGAFSFAIEDGVAVGYEANATGAKSTAIGWQGKGNRR